MSGSISTTFWASAPIRRSPPQSDSLHALVDGRVIELRVPYPMGFFAKQIDGRIDDPSIGCKGRGLWVTSDNHAPVHIEGVDAPAPGGT